MSYFIAVLLVLWLIPVVYLLAHFILRMFGLKTPGATFFLSSLRKSPKDGSSHKKSRLVKHKTRKTKRTQNMRRGTLVNKSHFEPDKPVYRDEEDRINLN